MKFHFFAADTPRAKSAYETLTKKYGQNDAGKSDVTVVLGGDGTMLEALHTKALEDKPYYGMNFGSVGFMMNPFHDNDLVESLKNAGAVQIHPLRMKAKDTSGKVHEAIAFNEVATLRETRQAAHIKISVDDVVRIPELVCDGIMLATPAGSTAYNLSAHGSILPLSSNMLAMTPISAFRPRRWRGALIPATSKVTFAISNGEKRPVSATADSQEFRDVVSIDIHQSSTLVRKLMFDPDHHLEERILKEQFLS